MKKIQLLTLITALTAAVGAFAQVPKIFSLTPARGQPGTVVTIGGTNFSTNLTENLVWFGPIRAIVTGATNDSLKVLAPTGAVMSRITLNVKGKTATSSVFYYPSFLSGSKPNFGAKTDLPTGSFPVNVAVGDFNSDGNADFATANYTENISVFLGDGAGGFALRKDYTVGGGTKSVTVADVDGDGVQDLLADYGSGTNSRLAVLHGVGNGAFGSRIAYVVGDYPQGLAVGDFNSDGFLDVVTANYTAGTVSVLINDKSGGFLGKVDYQTADSPLGVAVGDIDMDGNLDIVTDGGNGTTLILHGNGDGTFGRRTYLPAGGGAYGVGDFNGDRSPDIIAGYQPTVYLNDGLGGLLPGPAVPDGPLGLAALADLTGRGTQGIVAPGGTNRIRLLFGNGKGGFGGTTDIAAGSGTNILYGAAIADFNNDGLPDIVTANGFDNTASVILNRPPIRSRLTMSPPDPFDGSLLITVEGQIGVDLRIDASTNLLDWVPLISLPNPTGKFYLIESDKAAYGQRFFRAVDPY